MLLVRFPSKDKAICFWYYCHARWNVFFPIRRISVDYYLSPPKYKQQNSIEHYTNGRLFNSTWCHYIWSKDTFSVLKAITFCVAQFRWVVFNCLHFECLKQCCNWINLSEQVILSHNYNVMVGYIISNKQHPWQFVCNKICSKYAIELGGFLKADIPKSNIIKRKSNLMFIKLSPCNSILPLEYWRALNVKGRKSEIEGMDFCWRWLCDAHTLVVLRLLCGYHFHVRPSLSVICQTFTTYWNSICFTFPHPHKWEEKYWNRNEKNYFF